MVVLASAQKFFFFFKNNIQNQPMKTQQKQA